MAEYEEKVGYKIPSSRSMHQQSWFTPFENAKEVQTILKLLAPTIWSSLSCLAFYRLGESYRELEMFAVVCKLAGCNAEFRCK